MKNWDLLVFSPELAIATMPLSLNCGGARTVRKEAESGGAGGDDVVP